MTDGRVREHEEPEYPIFGTLAWRSDEDGCTHLVAQNGVPEGLRLTVVSGEGNATDITGELTRMTSPVLGGSVPAWLVPGPCTLILTIGDGVVTVEASAPW